MASVSRASPSALLSTTVMAEQLLQSRVERLILAGRSFFDPNQLVGGARNDGLRGFPAMTHS